MKLGDALSMSLGSILFFHQQAYEAHKKKDA